MKRFFTLISILVFIVLFITGCQAESKEYPKPTENFFVNDFAGVLSSQDEQFLQQMAVALQNKTTAQAVVVVIDSLDDESIEDYALNLFREWGIGQKDKNNGVLMLISVGDRRSRIEVGYGLEGALPDGKTGRIQDDYMLPWFRQDNYSEGIKNGYIAIIQEIYKEYGIEDGIEEYTPQKPAGYVEYNDDDTGPWPLLVILAIFAIDWIFFRGAITRFLFLSSMFGRRGGRGGGFGGGGFGGGGFRGGGGSTGGGGSSRGW